MKKVLGYMLMAPDGEGGAAAGKGGAGEGDGAGGEETGSLLDEGGAAGGKGGAGEGDGKGGAGGEETGSLLDEGGAAGGKGGAGEGDGKGVEDGKPKEPTAEEVEAYVGKIKEIDLAGGDGGPAPAWDSEAVKAVAPLFIKHKIGDAAANEIVAAYGKHVAGQYKAAAEADRAVLASLRAECGKRFGKDIRRFAAEGRRGGEHVFGKDTFSRLARVEAFGSDPDIIEALAKIGRGLTPDGAAGENRGGADEKSLAERMYGGKRK